MEMLDKLYLEDPTRGTRRMSHELQKKGHKVGRCHGVYRILCVNACIQILHLSSNLIKNCCKIIPQSRMGKVHFFSILAIAR